MRILSIGALNSSSSSYGYRQWELEKIESVDVFDCMGASIVYHVKDGSIVKCSPLYSSQNSAWCTDRIRYYIDSSDVSQFACPVLLNSSKSFQLTWSDAIKKIEIILLVNSMLNNFKRMSLCFMYDLYIGSKDLFDCFCFKNLCDGFSFSLFDLIYIDKLMMYFFLFNINNSLLFLEKNIIFIISFFKYNFTYLYMFSLKLKHYFLLIGIMSCASSTFVHYGLTLSSLFKIFLSLLSFFSLSFVTVCFCMNAFISCSNILSVTLDDLVVRDALGSYMVYIDFFKTLISEFVFYSKYWIAMYVDLLFFNSIYIITSYNLIVFELMENSKFKYDQVYYNIYAYFCFDIPFLGGNDNAQVSFLRYPLNRAFCGDLIIPIFLFVEQNLVIVNLYGSLINVPSVYSNANRLIFSIVDLVGVHRNKLVSLKKHVIYAVSFKSVYVYWANVYYFYRRQFTIYERNRTPNLRINYLVDNRTYLLTGSSCRVSSVLEKIRNSGSAFFSLA